MSKVQLYSSSPIVAEQSSCNVAGQDTVGGKLTAEVALKTLQLIEEVVESFTQLSPERSESWTRGRKRNALRQFCLNVGGRLLPLVLFLILCAVTLALLSVDLAEIRRCIDDIDDQKRENPNVIVEPPTTINGYRRTREEACRMETGTEWWREWGHAESWRWLAFIASYFPLGPVGLALSAGITQLVANYAIGGPNAMFLTYGLYKHLGWVIRNVLWLAVWGVLMGKPLQWARDASKWNTQADTEVWDDEFRDIHAHTTRALIAFILLSVLALVRSGFTKFLSLQFHHKNHFERMQKALVQENVVQGLSKPNFLPETSVVQTAGRSITLSGYDNAHWAALKWVSKLVESDDVLQCQMGDCDDMAFFEVKEKAVAVQLKLAELLSSDLLRMSGSPRVSDMKPHASHGFSGQDATNRVSSDQPPPTFVPNTMPSVLEEGFAADGTAAIPVANFSRKNFEGDRTRPLGGKPAVAPVVGGQQPSAFNDATNSLHLGGPRISTPMDPHDFLRAATSQPATGEEGARAANNWARLRMAVRKPSKSSSARVLYSALQQVVEQRRKERLPEQAAEAAAQLASSSPVDMEAEKQRRGLFQRTKESDVMRSARKAQRLASQLQRATEHQSENVHSTVNQLQAYLLHHKNIQVFSLAGADELEGQITNSVAARKLGYYIFWNLRQEDSGLAVAEGEVREAASRAGIKHSDAAWQLFDRNCDSSATLEEILTSVEQVFDNRDSLLHTLRDNDNVVQQVEYAIGTTLFVLWLFIAFAIYDAGAVQRTWTALSAGLLSFSFIFGNSIREVFENAIFLFFTHPFDVGDIINFEDKRYTVKSITLQYVRLLRVDGAAVSVPCSEVRTARIHNLTRSNNQWDNVKVIVDADTPYSALEEVAKAVHTSIKANPKWFGGSYRCWWTEAVPGYKLQLAVFYDHSCNGVDLLTVNLARTEMHTAVMRALQDAKVTYTLPPVRGGGGADDGRGDMGMSAVRGTVGGEQVGQAATLRPRGSGGEQQRAAAAQNALLLA